MEEDMTQSDTDFCENNAAQIQVDFIYIGDCIQFEYQTLIFMLYSNLVISILSQIRYSLVVILELNSVSEVQYKGMMTDR